MIRMRFGKCSDCREYKYLPEKAKCLTCIESKTDDWMVIHVNPFMGQRLFRDGLSEEEAKEIAEGEQYLRPQKKRTS